MYTHENLSSLILMYAVERTRTSTGVRPLPPQDSVSAIPPRPHVVLAATKMIIQGFKGKVKLFLTLNFGAECIVIFQPHIA